MRYVDPRRWWATDKTLRSITDNPFGLSLSSFDKLRMTGNPFGLSLSKPRAASGGLLFALCVAMTGCASLGDPLKKLQQVVAPAEAASAAAAPTQAPARIAEQAPVAPAAQRAFDDARRALAAGRADEAERGFRALAQAHPELGGPQANLGLIYRQAGKLPQAATALEQAVKLSPEQPVYFNQLGVTYRQLGQFGKARGAYEKALELDPGYAAACLNLGILHDLYLREDPRALELYERYLTLAQGKDAMVGKWIADLKNRKPGTRLVSKKEQP